MGFRMRAGALALLAALMPWRPAAAEDEFDRDAIVRNPVLGNYKGYAEFKMGRYAPARQIWEALAAGGDAEAHFNLGLLYEDGLGVAADIAQALAHYEAGARAGSGRAQFRLGLLHAAGGKVPRDVARARGWLEMAAVQGDRDAARILGALREEGELASNPLAVADLAHAAGDYVRAASLLQGLAAAGNVRAQVRLAWMHEAGQGLPRNLAEAARLFRQAAEAGDGEAQYALSVMLQTGRGQAQDPGEAARWLQRAAAQGYAPAVTAAKALAADGSR